MFSPDNFAYIDERLGQLSQRCISSLEQRGFSKDQIEIEPFLHLRYDRTDCAMLCTPECDQDCPLQHGDFEKTFLHKYQTEFGFCIKDCPIIVDDIRVRGVAKTGIRRNVDLPTATSPPNPVTVRCKLLGL